jgi:acyl carrier protein
MITAKTETLRRGLRQFIIDTFLVGDEKEILADSDSFMQKGYIDSTGILELTQHVETTYNIKIEDDEMVPDNLDSVDKLVVFVLRKTGS